MTTPTHILTSATLGVTYSQYFNIPTEISIPLVIITSLLIDVNVLWKPISQHHKDLSHYPIFYIMLSATISLFAPSFGLLVLLSAILHLLLDTFGLTIGVHWLSPFSKKELSFLPLDKSLSVLDTKEKRIKYFRSKYWIYELVVILLSVLLLIYIKY